MHILTKSIDTLRGLWESGGRQAETDFPPWFGCLMDASMQNLENPKLLLPMNLATRAPARRVQESALAAAALGILGEHG